MLRGADQMFRARLLAITQKESGAWLNALQVSSFGSLYWTVRALRLLLPSEWALIIVFR